MARNQSPSDEPTRLREVIERLFSEQAPRVLWRNNGASAKLIAGAETQDDCAVLELTGESSLVVGSDYVRGPQFTLYQVGLLSDYDLGYFLVCANLSDIAAMGAEPVGVLTVIRYDQAMPDASFESLMQGIADACTENGTLNIGGDIGTAERLTLSATALGMCGKGSALMRSGASEGDLLCLTGPVGAAGAAVVYYGEAEENRPPVSDSSAAQMLTAWRRPEPRLAAGRVLSKTGLATACMDTSDGLRASVETLASASGVGFEISQAQISLCPAVSEVAQALSLDPLSLAFSASVDFELAFTINPKSLSKCKAELSGLGLELQVIGNATRRQKNLLRTSDGRLTELPGVPWRHQGRAFRAELGAESERIR
jgi:thiamine-monophosphate kinase